MCRYLKQDGMLVLLVLLASACSTVAPPGSPAATTNPVQDPQIAAAGTQQPTHTVLSAGDTSPAPILPEEDIETEPAQDPSNGTETNRMNIQVNDHLLTATLADNSSAAALREALLEGPITINMRDYGGMEKVGSLGKELPRNDEQITTEAGDIILYQGNALVIYYAPNSWNFTRLGKINAVTAADLKEVLGDGSVTVTLSLPRE